MKVESEFYHLHSRKCILSVVGQGLSFCPGEMSELSMAFTQYRKAKSVCVLLWCNATYNEHVAQNSSVGKQVQVQVQILY